MARRPREHGGRRPKPVLYIACEDSRSAPAYFRELGRLYNDVVAIKLGMRDSNRTGPLQVVRRAADYREHEGGCGDERDMAWAVFDAEPQAGDERRREIDDALADAASRSVNVAVSNPCFEHWLRLHIEDADGGFGSSQEAASAFAGAWQSKIGGTYRKGSADFSRLVTGRDVLLGAMRRAERQHVRQGSLPPHRCSPCCTNVYLLIRALEGLAE